MESEITNRHDWDVIVVGGGIGGLTAAATAAGDGARTLLVEGRPLGGQARTEDVGRFKFNRGGHALYRRTAGRGVLKRLGVQVSGAAPPVKGGYGRLDDRLGQLPQNPGTLVATDLLDRGGKLQLARVLAGMVRWRPDRLAERSAEDWLDELAGGRPDVRYMLDMLCRLTTYCSDFEQVSADLVAGQMKAGFVSGVEYLDGGWQTMVDGLAEVVRERGGQIETARSVKQVVPDGLRPGVDLGDHVVGAGAVVLAAGTPKSSGALLPEVPAAWGQVGPPARAACWGLGLATPPERSAVFGLDRPLYFVDHSRSARGLAPEGAGMVEVMRYLRPSEHLTPEDTRAELTEHCRLAGVDPEEVEERRYLHDMTVCGALPLPSTGGMSGRPRVDSPGWDGVFVAGDWVGPVGHLADAALVSGEDAGRRAAARAAGLSVTRSVAA